MLENELVLEEKQKVFVYSQIFVLIFYKMLIFVKSGAQVSVRILNHPYNILASLGFQIYEIMVSWDRFNTKIDSHTYYRNINMRILLKSGLLGFY